MKSLALVILATSLLTGCFSNSVRQQEEFDSYTLIDDLDPKVLAAKEHIDVNLKSPLNKGSIVIKTSDVALRVTNSHKWAQSLDEQLQLLSASVLSKYALNPRISYEINVLQFYGSTNGKVNISLSCKALNANKPIFVNSYVYEGFQSDDGYEALVLKLKEGYISIMENIAYDVLAIR